jgi:hypothetical protein
MGARLRTQATLSRLTVLRPGCWCVSRCALAELACFDRPFILDSDWTLGFGHERYGQNGAELPAITLDTFNLLLNSSEKTPQTPYQRVLHIAEKAATDITCCRHFSAMYLSVIPTTTTIDLRQAHATRMPTTHSMTSLSITEHCQSCRSEPSCD